MTDAECKERANEELNVRRAQALEYTPTLQGSSQTNGTVWDFGQFVDVVDDVKNVHGNFLIKAVEYAQDAQLGTRTTLTCVPPDAYQVIAEATTKTNRTATL